VRLDVYGQGLVDIRGYQVAVEVNGGSRGVLAPGVVRIETSRDGYLFTGQPVSAGMDDRGSRLAGAIRQGGATASGPAYLGSFEFRASRDAAGTFRVGFRSIETMFRDSSNNAERVDALATVDIRIGGSSSGPVGIKKGISR
jgi:hypothetical protein